MKNTIILILSLIIFRAAYAQDYTLRSPNNQIEIKVSVGEIITYSVNYKNEPILLPSPIRLKFSQSPDIGDDLTVKEEKHQTIDDTWQPVLKQHANIHNHCNELKLLLEEKSLLGRTFGITFRAYNEGIAFRYEIPELKSKPELVLTDEKTGFRFPKNFNAWMTDYGSFNTHQENEFTKKPLTDIEQSKAIGLPMVIEANENLYLALTESNLTDWSGMYIGFDKTFSDGSVQLYPKLSPVKGDPEQSIKVNISTPNKSPWRVLMIGEKPGDLIESEIIMNLADPLAIENPSWIKPGRCAWDHWWSGEVKMNTETIKKYIDLANAMGFEYQLIDWHWYGNPFTDDFEPNPDADITTVNPDVDMPEILEYAKQKNVKLWLWLLWNHADKQMNEAFALYESWGIVGVKIDFMAADHQEMVQWYQKTIKKAAEHHLMVNFHGAYKPTGVRRTYPNLMTREGVLGNEYNGWSTRITPEHNVTIPFTRMLAGPMDYTPGGFLNKNKGEFVAGHPTQVMGTRCHELAKLVIYDSPIITVCDHPDHYYGQQGVEVLKEVSAEWDDTKVLSGKIGEHIVMARKIGEKWFVAAMTNSYEREITIKLDFLENGKYMLRTFADSEETKTDATILKREEKKVQNTDELTIKMNPGGGFVGIFDKK